MQQDFPPHIVALPLPAHAPADVRAWRIDIDLVAPLDVASAGVLNDDELARAKRFLRHADAARFATVRAALRIVLAMHVDDAHLVIDKDAHGRPYLAVDDAPDFNVSHSGAHGTIALSMQRKVGIDIEEARVTLKWRDLQSVVLGEADLRTMQTLPEHAQRAAFFDCWTAKEALLKAHGTGMGAGALTMESFSVLPRKSERYALSYDDTFTVAALAAPDGYAAALAWSE